MIANLYLRVGDFQTAEKIYVGYVSEIESNYHQDKICSDCYFLLAVFYLENKYYEKSLICFQKAKKIRKKIQEQN